MSTLTIRLPDAFKRDLLRFCKQQGTTAGDFVRQSLAKQMAVARFQALRNEILPLAEAQGILTDEDVFRIVS
jgi:hypothetical protein